MPTFSKTVSNISLKKTATLNLRPRIFWANAYCLLDTSSGASMAIREMLLQLVKQGFQVNILGATIFDDPKGATKIANELKEAKHSDQRIIKIKDGPLIHHLVKTQSPVRSAMTAVESSIWYDFFRTALDNTTPDIVYFYGGHALDLLVATEAKKRGINTVFYLANGNYHGTRWYEDVDLILTDSYATSKMYKKRLGIDARPIGAFIDSRAVIAEHRDPKHVLLINPSFAKGAGVVVRLAMLLEKRRPDIKFEVVESRGNWHSIVKDVSSRYGQQRDELSNVIITPNTSDMRPIYGRARVLLALSLCWESFGRVSAEAMMNGVPAIVSNHGGLPEVTGNGGITVDFPEENLEKPYTKIPSDGILESIIQNIERFFDDEDCYQSFSEKALEQGRQFRIDVSTQRFIKQLVPLLMEHNRKKFSGKRSVSAKVTKQKEIGQVSEGIEVIVVLAPWSSGSTAVTGYIDRLGAYSCPPYLCTNDERTPNSNEAIAFRDKLVELIDELTLAPLVENPQTAFRDWFTAWLDEEKAKAKSKGLKAIVLKHPIASFFIPEIHAVCKPKFIVLNRSISRIEQTRLRRKWKPIYGQVGAQTIYSKIYSELGSIGLNALLVSFDNFLKDPKVRQNVQKFCNLKINKRNIKEAEEWLN